MSLEPGELIEGKYRIVSLIGEGGMGAVYEGENVRIRRRVAIKVLHMAFTGNAEVTQRFEREAQAAGRIGNDHILEVLDMGSLSNGDHFMVMEYLDGETLSQRIKGGGRLSPRAFAPLGRQMLAGLSAAHAAGIIHRDLKPDNVFILKEKAGKRDFVKIIDFGISKFQPLSGDGMKMTRTGAVMGTPYYMSPEQASGSTDADARSDVYSVAVMFYEAVTGRVPFDASTFNQLMFKIVLSDSPPPQSIVPDLDPAFCSLILKGMCRDVRYRFQSAAEFTEALDAWVQTGRGVSLPPPGDTSHVLPGAHAALPAAPVVVAAAATTSQPGVMTGGTAGSWATSQADLAVPMKKSKGGLIAAAAVAALMVLGGGALAAMKLSGGSDAPAAAASDPTEPSAKRAAAAEPAKTPAPPVPEAKPQTAAASEAKPSVAPGTSATSDEKRPALGAERTKARSAPPKPPSKPAALAQKPAGTKPAEKPAAKAPAQKPAGVPDFGY
ncbi:MAG TPA: serine/threonine-protein kinase [Polyangiaceae bacterium]